MENHFKFNASVEDNQQEFINVLSEVFPLEPESAIIDQRTFFDTFDWRLYDNDLALYESADELFLRRLNDNALLKRQPINSTPVMADDLPPTLKDDLYPVIAMRTLMKLADVTVRATPYRVLNRDKKTVVWLIYREITPPAHQNFSQPTAYVCVRSVRGYPKHQQTLMQQLKKMGLTPILQGTYMLALESAGRQPGDYSAKLNIQLDPQMRADEATKELLRFLLGIMKRNEPYIKKDIDTEFLHDFRVAVRRTRSVLSQVKEVFPEKTTERYKKDFSYIGKLSNDLRDLDVYLLAEDHYRTMLPDVLHNDINPLFDYLKQNRVDALEKVVNGLNSKEYVKILKNWEAFLNQPPPKKPKAANATRPIIDLARERIFGRYRRIVKDGTKILDNTEDEKLHDLRLECKKLRYLMEFFASLFPAKEMSKLTRQLKRLQENLGDFNDLSVQEDYLLSIAGELPLTQEQQSRQTLLAIGSLVDTLHLKRIKVKSEFAQKFTTFASPANKHLFKKLFAPDKKKEGVR